MPQPTRLFRLHPDRQSTPTTTTDGVGIREINLAWEVLGDTERRREYDQARKIHLANLRSNPLSNSSAFAHSISLDLFTPHFPQSTTSPGQEVEEEEVEPEYYTYSCRCSSQFKITTRELEEGIEVVGCEGCSERCRVEYEEVVEEEG
ncbi:hypothetical protein JCM3765_004938 [Sporobolomyces pararoseus]